MTGGADRLSSSVPSGGGRPPGALPAGQHPILT
ncbi:MAG: hypothetical protein QOF84_6388 [Streptomyces sp.]|jgi:hypothetical protein|nr:hypothetical protein [Streptomyces sp.]